MRRQADIADSSTVIARMSMAATDSNIILVKKSVAVAESSVFVAQRIASIQKDEVNISNKATEIAAISLKSKTLQDSITARSVANQVRAYITVDAFRTITYSPGKRFEGSLVFENVGQTPASNCMIFAEELHSGVASFTITPSYVKERRYPSVAVLGAKQTAEIRPISGDIMDSAMIQNLNTGKLHYFWYGMFTYTDIFNQRDTTKFATIFVPDSTWFGYADRYNEMK